MLKITTPTLMAAPVVFACSFRSFSMEIICSSTVALVDLSNTNTTSDARVSWAAGRDSVTWDL